MSVAGERNSGHTSATPPDRPSVRPTRARLSSARVKPVVDEQARIEGVVSVYILVRLLIGLGLLAVALRALLERPSARESLAGPFTLAAAMFLVMGLSAAAVRKHGRARWFGWTQMAIDAVFAGTLVSMTGGPVSPLFPLVFLNVVAAAFVLPGRAAVVVAGLDAVLYLGILAVQGLPWLSAQMGNDLLLTYSQVLLQVFAFLLVGMLSSVLSENLRRTRQELARQVAETQALRARHDLILEQVDAGVIVVDPDGRIVDQNPAARRLVGDALQVPLVDVLHPDSTNWEEVRRTDDGMLSLLCSRSALADGHEVVFVEDVTRLREMEAVVEREERLSAVGRLAAGLAHEIRNPLASLSGSVQLLRDEGRSPLHDIVLREVKRLNELVDDFLDSARPVRLNLSDASPGAIIGDVATAFKNDQRYQGRRVLRTRAARVPSVRMDAARFRQVVWNLLLNAAQATPDYGTITIELRAEDEMLRVAVSDDGVGIDPVALRKIFDPFYTTRSGGTGLGLANVDRIVRAHGGRVEVDSTPGEGTTFLLLLPLRGPAESPNLSAEA